MTLKTGTFLFGHLPHLGLPTVFLSFLAHPVGELSPCKVWSLSLASRFYILYFS